MDLSAIRADANRLHRAGQLDDAARLYLDILARDPADLNTSHMLGVLRLQQGRAAEALDIIAAVAAQAHGSAEVRTHHGLALHELGRHDEALADFDRALALHPDHPMTLLYRGSLLQAMGRLDAALADHDRLVTLSPGDAEAWFRRGNALWRMDRAEDAAASFEKAHAIDPSRFGALFNRATALMRLERFDEAFAAYEKARALAPDHKYLLGSAAGAVLGGCDLARWPAYRDLLSQGVAARSAVVAPLTFLAFSDDPVLQRICSETFAADRVPSPSSPLWSGDRYRHDRIRIAYLSADFRQHATADLIAGLIERHDRARFEVTALSFSRDDATLMRARLAKAFDHFIEIGDKTDAEAAQILRDAEIDIAIDLKGHTDDSRPGILSHRPCPVQVQYLGYPGTIGTPWLDYILADAMVLPFDRQPFYSEKIVHLPHCYQVNDATRPIADKIITRADVGLPESGFVFCCFNAAWKIAPVLFEVWMRLLNATPGSVLWLLADNADATRNLKLAATARGVDPARLVFAPRVSTADHMARHAQADLFLDTLPYNAHTTASDALWAGLPLLTCMGNTFPARVAASLLTTIGLTELITHTPEDYESLALALARDPQKLASLRQNLSASRQASPLFDTDLFRRHIEAAYARMMEISGSGQPPRNFAIPA